ncbi:MAG: hypothetical protein JWL70_1813, partial [Acidimicrobiia bacterium]|nr:hypothetical protein [Acidimicrobiia bacterium]
MRSISRSAYEPLKPLGPEPAASIEQVGVVSRSELVSSLVGLAAPYSVLYVDLDRFHQVNARWGQGVGDRVLEVVLRRLRHGLPPNSLITRATGDAFAVFVPEVVGKAATLLAERLLDSIARPLAIDGFEVMARASAGVASWNGETQQNDLLEEAFLACRRAKEDGRRGVVVSAAEMGISAVGSMHLEDELRRAIDEEELRLYYQPEICLHTGRVTGVEALVRWQHPTRGLLSPDSFLGVAESSGLILAIGEWVLAEAIVQAERWRTLSDEPVRVWVNLAASQLASIGRVMQLITSQLELGFDPRCLGLEVTESSLLSNLDAAVQTLTKLKHRGIEIALDDFGTGYSSLAYLRRLPVSTVKIDRSFVSGLNGSLADSMIVEAVVELSHALGLRVVAEGVEDRGQAEALLDAGVDLAQGYYFSRPVPAEEIAVGAQKRWFGAHMPDRISPHGVALAHGRRAQVLFGVLDVLNTPTVVTTATATSDGPAPVVLAANQAALAELRVDAATLVGRGVDRLADFDG